jgi:hypothetical protein
MKNQEQQITEKIEIIIGNVIAEANTLKEWVDVAGNEKFKTKIGKISLLDLINPSKLDAKSFIALISIMGRKDVVFGNLPDDVIQAVCVDMCGDNLTQELKNIFN